MRYTPFFARVAWTACFLAVGVLSGWADESAPTAAELEFFEKRVRPLLAEHCYSCHSVQAEKIQAGLLLDSRASAVRGGDSGAALVPGDAEASLLIEAVHYESYEMPPDGKLPAEEIKVLEEWISLGAPWPQEAAPEANQGQPEFDLASRKAEHWIWQPLQTPVVPTVADPTWPRNDIDRFVLARLEQQQLRPATDAQRSTLLRRLYFDLIGLPPTPEQTTRFLDDKSPGAVQRVVDELLESQHFGERWGRHWLDLVRYAESRGHEYDNDTPNAYQYRDYVIRALNADVPYDQFVTEHIAGDLLAEPRLHPGQHYNESILGTGFWFLGEWVHSPVDIRKDEADRFDNMLDVMSKTFLGVTAACARCHDHKFDAISTADYYSLSGFLQSSDYRQVRFESLEHNRRVARDLAALDKQFQSRIQETLAGHELRLPTAQPIDEQVAAVIVFDYAQLAADEFMQDGFSFGSGPRQLGQPYLATEGEEHTLQFAQAAAGVSDPFWNQLESVSEKGMHNRGKLAKLPRSGRTLRTPTFELKSGSVACRVRGAGHVVACVDSHRLIAGPLHGQTIRTIQEQDDWVKLDLSRYVGHRLHLEFTPAAQASLEVSLVTQGASDAELEQLSRRAEAIAESARRFAAEAKTVLAAKATDWVRSWGRQREQLQARVMRRSRLAMAMMDGTGEDDHVLIRGNASKPGPVAARSFLTAIAGEAPLAISSGSGRLELAQQINDAANPLAHRVIVNRIWHYLMGRGIVPTTDDFGVLGSRPTHPELLDHLASRFLSDGRSIKRMIRYLVLSRTYQMSGVADDAAVAVDPKNLLWHHRPPKRLQGEAIRDSLLVLSGRLNATQFGEPVPIHLTPFMDGRGRPERNGPLDGDGRRSIYTAVRRNFVSPFMLAFDTPIPFSTMGRRNESNVPAQALILMNDPFVVAQAEAWAQRTMELHSPTPARIEWMYLSALARRPTPDEVAIASGFLEAQMTARGVDHEDRQLWADLAHALINAKEFVFLR